MRQPMRAWGQGGMVWVEIPGKHEPLDGTMPIEQAEQWREELGTAVAEAKRQRQGDPAPAASEGRQLVERLRGLRLPAMLDVLERSRVLPPDAANQLRAALMEYTPPAEPPTFAAQLVLEG